MTKKTLLLAAIAASSSIAGISAVNAQTTGDFRSATTGTYATAASWETYNGTAWVTAGAAPTAASANAINILSGNTISVAAAGSGGDQMSVNSGGQLSINSAITFTLANGAGTDLTINGTVLNSGTLTATGATIVVASGGTYIHNTASSASTLLGLTTLQTGSTFIYRGSSSVVPAVSLSGRTFYNLSFDVSSGSYATAAASGAGALAINGDLLIGSGVSVNFGTYTGTTTTAGNVTVNGTMGSTTNNAPSFTINSGKALTVGSGGLINLGTGKTVTIASGGSLTGSGTITGAIAMNGTFSPGTGSAGTFTTGASSTLTLSSTSAFVFDLGSSNDLISMTGGTLDLGSGVIDFSDFTFVDGGITATTYTLISGATTLSGSLALTGLSGTIGGYTGTLSTSGNNLILTTVAAVPEPHVYGLAIAVLLGVVVFMRRRKAAMMA